MKRALALILALTMVMALVACGGDKPTSSTPSSTPSNPSSTPSTPDKPTEPSKPAEPEKPAEPKILKISQASAAANAWGAVAQNSADLEIQDKISGTLYKVLPIDGKAILSPLMAAGEPVDVNGDGKTWNITVSDKAMFENGEKITADTFMYTFKMALDPKLVFPKASGVGTNYITVVNGAAYYNQGQEGKTPVAWEDVGFKKVDEMTIQVICESAVTKELVMRHFSSRLTTPVYQPLFEQCLAADGLSSTYGSSADKIISSGPFKLTNWVIGAVREYEKNENYARADLIKLDGILSTTVEDSGTRQQMFEKGELSYISLSAAGLEQYGDDPRIMSVPSRVCYKIEFNTYNTEKPIINNENFRKALYYGTDREQMSKMTTHLPATGIVGQRSTAQADGTTFRQLADKAGYLPANNGYDPDLAKQYFETALKEEGLTSLELTLLCRSDDAQADLAEMLQEIWQNVFGADKFKLNINAMPSSNNSTARKSWKTNPNGYEICFSTFNLVAGDFDPVKDLAPYTSGYSNRNAPYDVHAELNALYDEATSEANILNLDRRNELALEMEKYIIEHAVIVPVLYQVTYTIQADNLVLPLGNWDIELGWGYDFCDIAQ